MPSNANKDPMCYTKHILNYLYYMFCRSGKGIAGIAGITGGIVGFGLSNLPFPG